jgi:hypothetical protein
MHRIDEHIIHTHESTLTPAIGDWLALGASAALPQFLVDSEDIPSQGPQNTDDGARKTVDLFQD